MTPSERERLDSLLDEWQSPAAPTADADRDLCLRVKARACHSRLWWSVAAAGAAAALLAGLVYLGPLTPAPAARTVDQIAVMQDMQLFNRNADLIEHLDFLTAPAPRPPDPGTPE